MKLHDLTAVPGSTKEPKRIGRGAGSGQGKTAGKGHKGQKARSGGGVRPGFEGGQMPLQRRIPKRGFVNIFANPIVTVNVGSLEKKFENGAVVDNNALQEERRGCKGARERQPVQEPDSKGFGFLRSCEAEN